MWKEKYLKVLHNVCEKKQENVGIVELPMPVFEKKLVYNENAEPGALYKFKLDEDKATELDYKFFCEYVYDYMGLDIKDYM